MLVRRNFKFVKLIHNIMKKNSFPQKNLDVNKNNPNFW